jgi:hypothetical protein
MALAAILLASTLFHGAYGTPLYRERSFFGVHRVTERDQMRRLIHGGTVHGIENLALGEQGKPLTYYHLTSPIGQLMHAMEDDPRCRRVAVVGLGAGSMAYYSQPGARWTFFEIDPAVIRIAKDRRLFTFLSSAHGTVDVIEGDGRLQLAQADDRFGLIVLDAFGSDAIPVHLLTREAMDIYQHHLEPHGILAFHISNNYLKLEPIIANLAQAASPRLIGYTQNDPRSDDELAAGKLTSVWAVLARSEDDLPASVRKAPWRLAQPRGDLPVWTDHYSNIWRVFEWGGTLEQ